MRVEWNPKKAANNLHKHSVSFYEAATVFKDPLAFIFDDTTHSQEEHREIIIGTSALSRIILA